VGPCRVVEGVKAPVGLHQLAEAPAPPDPGELLGVSAVAPLDLPVQVRAPRPDAAVADPRGLAGEGEGVQPDFPARGRLRGSGGPSW